MTCDDPGKHGGGDTVTFFETYKKRNQYAANAKTFRVGTLNMFLPYKIQSSKDETINKIDRIVSVWQQNNFTIPKTQNYSYFKVNLLT